MPKIAIIYNLASGESQEKELRDLVAEHSEDIALFAVGPKGVDSAVKKIFADGFETIVAAGGDGTISSVVTSIMRSGLPVKFGVLPTGTYNHFASDLGIPPDLPRAFELLLKGNTRLIDVGKVNDSYFVNTSSVGLYSRIIQSAESKEKSGWKRKRARIAAWLELFVLYPSITVEFENAGNKNQKRALFVFIGNNKYHFSGVSFGGRKSLDENILSVCIVNSISRFGLFVLGLHILRGTALNHNDFNVIGLSRCTIHTITRNPLVSRDGEVSRMSNPLKYEILPKALKVIV